MRLTSLSALMLLAAPLAAQEAPDTLAQTRAKYVNAIREQIKGREEAPAESVFKNIQTLKGMPAGRLLGMMEMGWSRALGVSCDHCHDPEKWDSDDKRAKLAARDMVGMTRAINADYIRKMANLRGENPVVNCNTCHNGRARPGAQRPAN
ncbi:MAG TPA: c-type cytochrome [Gemmatimonadales bacterium]